MTDPVISGETDASWVETDASNIDTPEPPSVFGLLSAERRQHVILILDWRGATEKGVLADLITEHEAGEGYDSMDRKSVYVCLHQCHLTKLADAGAIEYDNERVVRPTPMTHELAEFLRDSYGRFGCRPDAPWTSRTGGRYSPVERVVGSLPGVGQ